MYKKTKIPCSQDSLRSSLLYTEKQKVLVRNSMHVISGIELGQNLLCLILLSNSLGAYEIVGVTPQRRYSRTVCQQALQIHIIHTHTHTHTHTHKTTTITLTDMHHGLIRTLRIIRRKQPHSFRGEGTLQYIDDAEFRVQEIVFSKANLNFSQIMVCIECFVLLILIRYLKIMQILQKEQLVFMTTCLPENNCTKFSKESHKLDSLQYVN